MIKKIEGLKRIYIGKLPDGISRDRKLANIYGYNRAIDDVIKLLNMHIVVLQREPLCEIYEPDDTTEMNCKHCKQPQFMHD